MKRLLPLVLSTGLLCTQACLAEEPAELFSVDHTQLDTNILRIYASGENGTSIRDAVHTALDRAKVLCQEQDYPYFYIVDTQTLYRQNQTIRQASYTSRGTAEVRGTDIGASRELQGGSVDIDYHDSVGTRKVREHPSINSNNVYATYDGLPTYPSSRFTSKESWAAITIRLLKDNTQKVGKTIYPASRD